MNISRIFKYMFEHYTIEVDLVHLHFLQMTDDFHFGSLSTREWFQDLKNDDKKNKFYRDVSRGAVTHWEVYRQMFHLTEEERNHVCQLLSSMKIKVDYDLLHSTIKSTSKFYEDIVEETKMQKLSMHMLEI